MERSPDVLLDGLEEIGMIGAAEDREGIPLCRFFLS